MIKHLKNPTTLKELIIIMSRPIALLLNKSTSQGVVPVEWKQAYVSSIYKKVLEIVPKIIAQLVRRKFPVSCQKPSENSHEASYRSTTFLSPKQHGFISGRSTTTQLLTYLDKCLKTIVDGGVVNSIYMDFSKTCLPRRRLIGNLME